MNRAEALHVYPSIQPRTLIRDHTHPHALCSHVLGLGDCRCVAPGLWGGGGASRAKSQPNGGVSNGPAAPLASHRTPVASLSSGPVPVRSGPRGAACL